MYEKWEVGERTETYSKTKFYSKSEDEYMYTVL